MGSRGVHRLTAAKWGKPSYSNGSLPSKSTWLGKPNHCWVKRNISRVNINILLDKTPTVYSFLAYPEAKQHTHIYIYMSRDPHTPPSPSQMVPPPLWQGRGGFLSSQADIRKIYSSVQGVCQQCPRYCVSSTGEYT